MFFLFILGSMNWFKFVEVQPCHMAWTLSHVKNQFSLSFLLHSIHTFFGTTTLPSFAKLYVTWLVCSRESEIKYKTINLICPITTAPPSEKNRSKKSTRKYLENKCFKQFIYQIFKYDLNLVVMCNTLPAKERLKKYKNTLTKSSAKKQ